MNPQQTAGNYNRIANHWNSPDFNRENGVDQHKRALRFSNQSGAAIDIGCGSSGRVIDLLLAHGFQVEGLDISSEMVRLARLRHPEVTFHEADIVTFDFTKAYDFISAWDSIWHAPLEHQQAVLEKLCDALTPGGVLIFTSGGVDAPGEVTNPFLGQPLYHAALGIPSLLRVVAGRHCVCRHLEYDQATGGDPGLHLYLIVQKVREAGAPHILP